jgi:hypothetical protein
VYHVSPDGIHPLACALVMGKFEVASLLLLHYLKHIASDFFSLAPKFMGGIISDHTEVFVILSINIEEVLLKE